jgi:hypothetical protein
VWAGICAECLPAAHQLLPTEQGTLRECAAQGRDEHRKLNRAQEIKALAKFKAEGIVINDVSHADSRESLGDLREVQEIHRFRHLQDFHECRQSDIGILTCPPHNFQPVNSLL